MRLKSEGMPATRGMRGWDETLYYRKEGEEFALGHAIEDEWGGTGGQYGTLFMFAWPYRDTKEQPPPPASKDKAAAGIALA